MNCGGNEHSRTSAIRDRVRSDPSSVDIADVVASLVHGDRDERRIAIEAYDTIVRNSPDAVDDAAAALEAHLTDDSVDVRRRAAKTAATLIEHERGEFGGIVASLGSLAGDPSEPAREPAVIALATLALERPEDVASASGVLCEMACACLVDPRRSAGESTARVTRARDPTVATNPERNRRDRVRIRAMAGLTRIAVARPAALREHASEIGALLEDDHHLVRTGACEILESLATAYPADVEPFTSALASRVEADTKHPVPRRAAAALDAVGAASPDRVGEAVATIAPAIEALLETRDPDTRRTGVSLLAYAAVQRPETVERFVPTLRERHTDDPDERVRTLAGHVLECLERDASVSPTHERTSESNDGT